MSSLFFLGWPDAADSSSRAANRLRPISIRRLVVVNGIYRFDNVKRANDEVGSCFGQVVICRFGFVVEFRAQAFGQGVDSLAKIYRDFLLCSTVWARKPCQESPPR